MARVNDAEHGGSRDRGSMTILTLLVCLAVCAATLAAMVPVLAQVIEHQRAQQAADAAALAGVTGGRGASSRLAAANSGVVVSWSRSRHDVVVTVRVGDQLATARATDAP